MEHEIVEYTDKGRAFALVETFWKQCPQIETFKEYSHRLKIIRWSVSVAFSLIVMPIVYLLFHFQILLPKCPLSTQLIITGVAGIVAFGIPIITLIMYVQRRVYNHYKYIKKTEFVDLAFNHDKYLVEFQNDPVRARAYHWIVGKIADYEVARIKFDQASDLHRKETLKIRREHKSTTPPTIDQFENEYRRHFGYQKKVPNLDDILQGFLSNVAEPTQSTGIQSIDIGSTVTSTTKSAAEDV